MSYVSSAMTDRVIDIPRLFVNKNMTSGLQSVECQRRVETTGCWIFIPNSEVSNLFREITSFPVRAASAAT